MSNSALLLLIWLAALGGCVGSFLNVVVYRLPRGQSLLHPGSRCPACDHPIRCYHNIPVLGWLALRGRCRDCGSPIRIRYPLVEAVVAILFAGLAVAILSVGQAPGDLPTDWRRWCLYASLAVAGCVSLGMALIKRDRARIPGILWPMLGVSLALAVILLTVLHRP